MNCESSLTLRVPRFQLSNVPLTRLAVVLVKLTLTLEMLLSSIFNIGTLSSLLLTLSVPLEALITPLIVSLFSIVIIPPLRATFAMSAMLRVVLVSIELPLAILSVPEITLRLPLLATMIPLVSKSSKFKVPLSRVIEPSQISGVFKFTLPPLI